MTNSTIDITDTKFKAWLAEAAYGNFSKAMERSGTSHTIEFPGMRAY